MRRTLMWAMLGLVSARAEPQTPATRRASARLESIRGQPVVLRQFLDAMPKGADLHHHLEGSVYAEQYIRWAAEDGLCVVRRTLTLVPPPCADSSVAVSDDPVFYEQLVDAFSMRNWTPARDAGAEHFFLAFGKFDLAAQRHPGDMLAEVMAQAGRHRVQYLEIMYTLDQGQAERLGARVGWYPDIRRELARLDTAGLSAVVTTTRRVLDQAESRARDVLRCGTSDPRVGCDVTVRWIYQALRERPPEQVAAQLALGFRLAQADPRVVAINLVMPEHWPIARRDFLLHMQMVHDLHEIFPAVHIALHAGELAFGQVPPEDLRSHIRASVEMGFAERIGHGASVGYEREARELLREMARRNVLVEICLTSNDYILGLRGAEHPLPIYMRYGVPVALATDDQGVSRTDITREYERATVTYDLRYAQLKWLARESLEHSFLPGRSVWVDRGLTVRARACAEWESASCRAFLDHSERARQQRQLEARFAEFESSLTDRTREQ